MQLRSLLLSLAVVLSVVALELPNCARTCLAPTYEMSRCHPEDQACHCTDQALIKNATACIMVKCTIKEALLAKNVTATACGEPIRDKSPGFVAVSNVFGILSSLCVIQRFAFKYWTKAGFGLDDWATLAAMVISVPSIAINALVVGPNGMGRDTWTLSYENITTFSRFFFVLEILYFADVGMIKIALIFFYLRIFPAREVRRLLQGTLGFAALFGLVFTAIAIFQCSPINYYWWRWDGEHSGRCLDMNAITWSNAGVSIAIDIWMLAIPLWQLKSLKLDWKKKVGVAIMFCVGTFVTVVSVLRLRALDFSSHSANPTWDLFDVGIWSTVEINVGIMCVCMPSLRLLLVHLFPTLSTSSSQQGYIRHEPPSRQRVVDNKIVQQVSYSVEYGDKEETDDLRVVYLRDVDVRSMPVRGGGNVI
ncbi:hypothetical protein CP533_0872 [Ophiocordyceps camponoti-saundersi (nom. inval.)]|nr:hypothetical protein CP533_0872 [Ophiocordyceps camponoti-saundersi (nom. inval.)]